MKANRFRIFTLLFAALSLLGTAIQAQPLVSYTFGAPGEATFEATVVADGLSASPITAGAGLQDELAEFTVNEGHAAESGHPDVPHLWVTDDDWASQANAGEINNLESDFYFTFTLTPDDGATLDLHSLRFDAAAGSNSSVRRVWIYSSIHGFDSVDDEIAAIEIDAGTHNIPDQNFGTYTVALEDPAFQDIAGPVEFRFYYGTNWFGGSAFDNIAINDTPVTPPFEEWALSRFDRDSHGNHIIPTGTGEVYEVGPGQEYESLVDVPMNTLGAGDTVRLHWRPEPYVEKVVVGGQGTEDEPIVFVGVPNERGELPVIDGNNAMTRPGMSFPNQNRGVVTVEGGDKPSWIYIANLEIRGGREGNFFTDSSGEQVEYRINAAGVNILRGDYIHVLNCTITDCGNGIFTGSYASEDCIDSWCADGAYVSSDLLIEGCRVYDNGYADSTFEHNLYNSALRSTIQYNYLGPVKEGSLGVQIKERSAGNVIRYNWIEGTRPVDLVETGIDQIREAPEYRYTLVYGNVIIKTFGENVGNQRIIHYGGDNGNFPTYRKGTLYLYHNTIISRRENATLFGLTTGDEVAVVRNNIIHADPEFATEFYILDGQGTVHLENNWITSFHEDHQRTGGEVIAAHNVTGDDPGFLDYAAGDFHLLGDSPARDIAGEAPEALGGLFPVRYQYIPTTRHESRADLSDAGAYGPADPVYLYFRDTISTEDEGWSHSATFGLISTADFPWVYSLDHAWIWADGTGANEMWFYDPALAAWWWTAPNAYPWIWDFPRIRWICYFPGSREPRYFWDHSHQSWISDDDVWTQG